MGGGGGGIAISYKSELLRDRRKTAGKKNNGSKKEKLKVQSVSELADLITSGTIQVPRSLTHYMNDPVQLLDQVFTILSPEDVKGKLPDILKVSNYVAVQPTAALLECD